MSLLTKDLDEQESLRVAKEEEQERAMYSGRKARKERRAFREQRLQALLMNRCLSPPRYAFFSNPSLNFLIFFILSQTLTKILVFFYLLLLLAQYL